MQLKDALLPEFEREMATTRNVLARCSDDSLQWRPHPKSWTMAELATHIANMAGWTIPTLTQDSMDIAPAGAPPYKEEPAASQQAVLALFDKNAAAGKAALESATDEQLMKSWSLLAGGQTIFTMPRIAVLRSLIMNHSIHHRGQLSVYLRLNDIPVPSIYGPSADEPSM